jgi:glycosyltransferase involved in cell wall biosynthesis
MNIAFLWYFSQASQVYENWRDGLRAALEIVAKKHSVTYFLDKTAPDPSDNYDFILFWDDSNSPFFNELDKYKCRKGLCLTTDPTNIDNLRKLDVVFCESQPVYDAVRSHGIYAVKAFGTDTDFFKPNPKKNKDIPYFYPATFSPWKRQDELVDLGNLLWLVGTIQPDGLDIYQKCANKGCHIEVGYFPAVKIRNYFQRAESVPIPAIHGSERTVLEAMATDILPLVIHPTNRRTFSYIEEFRRLNMKSPREFVLKNYSHVQYAEALLKGIENE